MARRQALFKRYHFLPDNIPQNIPTMDNTSIRVADNFDLASIKSPADIKRLTVDELQVLADRLRVPLTEKLGRHGGHVGPNLGFMEATIALHYVFDAPADKLVFDVSHQTYPHKMLTGRIQAFLDPAHYDDVTGYTSPKESPYDLFSVGHTSTSVALAAGLAKARDLRGGKENVVAIIGDGSLSGGEAFEGLDYAATLGTNFIVVVNDNPYSFILNEKPISLLQVPGAKDCCIEFNSMSKSHNMPGWRVGMCITNATFISWILKVKSNIDSGTFRGLQLAAAKALTENTAEWHREANVDRYRRRRRYAEEIMDVLGCEYDRSQVGMFLWGRIPDSYGDVEQLTEKVLHEARVFITPGFIFGSRGERYIRISLCAKEEKLGEALERIKKIFK